jgi:hypothetical protein
MSQAVDRWDQVTYRIDWAPGINQHEFYTTEFPLHGGDGAEKGMGMKQSRSLSRQVVQVVLQ